jgi:cobalt-zinc-cadmium efflux system outer membrane protein
MTPEEAEAVDIRGAIAERVAVSLPPEGFFQIALASRPDLMAARLGVGVARADARLARADRYQDIYVLYQPYTYQANFEPGAIGSHSWALGVTVALPIYNRNQGNILRTQINISQVQMRLATLESLIASEVRHAERDYANSRNVLNQIERALLPGARMAREDALHRYGQGELGTLDYLEAEREYNDIVRQYRDTLVRHRRNMLNINTAVGRRLLP